MIILYFLNLLYLFKKSDIMDRTYKDINPTQGLRVSHLQQTSEK